MQRLEASDERRVGRFVTETAAMELGSEPFPAPFLSAFRRLARSDDVVFCELDRVREIELRQVSEPVYDGPEAVSYWEIRHEHPTCSHQDVTGDFRAHRVSEFISRRELPEIVTWLGARPGEPLEVSADDGSLVVRAVGGALLLEERPAALGLTRREREVVELVGEGLTNAQIAERLWISPGTVRRHLENAYEKLGVSTRTAAVRALSLDR